jgi:hypothetical protein
MNSNIYKLILNFINITIIIYGSNDILFTYLYINKKFILKNYCFKG